MERQEERKRRPRIKVKQGFNKEDYKPTPKPKKKSKPKTPPVLKDGKKFKVIYPTWLDARMYGDERLIFVETTKGYKCELGNGEYLGFPKSIIENNSALYLPL